MGEGRRTRGREKFNFFWGGNWSRYRVLELSNGRVVVPFVSASFLSARPTRGRLFVPDLALSSPRARSRRSIHWTGDRSRAAMPPAAAAPRVGMDGSDSAAHRRIASASNALRCSTMLDSSRYPVDTVPSHTCCYLSRARALFLLFPSLPPVAMGRYASSSSTSGPVPGPGPGTVQAPSRPRRSPSSHEHPMPNEPPQHLVSS